MGRTKQTARKRNRDRGKSNQKEQHVPYERQSYKLQTKNNEQFEAYYQSQGIVPEGEWESFLEALRSPLPCTFRITGFKKQSKELLKLIKGEYLDKLMDVEVEGRVIKPPKCLPWYPDELAWQLDMDRKFIRQCNPLKKLHQFLIEETDSGNISRQEAVSMIPPLVMDVQPHHKVLDMCAAPGSKTAQLIEMLHDCDDPVPDGCVVANDSDNKRCYLMTHQIKRLESASFVIVNQDASTMPNFKIPNEEGVLRPVRFDRVLADVPCSGDGTMRKNVDAWGKWNVHTGMHLHNIQSRILSRGLEMLAVGGRIVYSTCSMNPVEDEAVVSNLLRRSQGTVRLINIATALPGLKGQPGLSAWKVMSRDMDQYTTPEELPDKLKSTIRPSVFPPSPEEAENFNLHKCLRILPHHQDTGGFFISLLEKVEELPWVTKSNKPKNAHKPKTEETNQSAENAAKCDDEENGSQTDKPDGAESEDKVETNNDAVVGGSPGEGNEGTENMESTSTESDKRKREFRPDSPPQRKRKRFGYKEDPFVFLTDQDPIWAPIRDFFKLKDFPVHQLLVRCVEGKKRNLYFASPIVKSLVDHNIDRLKFINLGLKILSRSDSPYVSCPFRTVQEGVAVLYPHVTDRVVSLTKDDIVTLLSTEMPFLVRFSKGMQEGLKKHIESSGQGSVIFVYDPTKDDRPDSPKCDIVLCGWLGRTSCRSFIAMNERGHYLRLCGSELKTKGEKPKRDKLSPDEIIAQTEGSVDKVKDEPENKDMEVSDDKDSQNTDVKDVEKTENKDIEETDDKDIEKTGNKDIEGTGDKDIEETEEQDIEDSGDKVMEDSEVKDTAEAKDDTEIKDIDDKCEGSVPNENVT